MKNSISTNVQFLMITLLLSCCSLVFTPQTAVAKEDNYCNCDVSSGSCSCSKNWSISPWATHTYRMECGAYTDAAHDGTTDTNFSGYGMSDTDLPVLKYYVDGKYYWFHAGLEGKGEHTTCTGWDDCGSDDPGGAWPACLARQCTNWKMGSSDSTTTTVTCYMSDGS